MTTDVQTSYTLAPAAGLPGLIVDEPGGHKDVVSRMLVTAALAAGLPVMRAPASGDRAAQPLSAPSVGDVDAILVTGVSTAGVQTLDTELDGVIGTDRFVWPVNLQMVFNSHADWNATTAVVSGLDQYGRPQTEDFAIPDGGNATVTGTKFWSKVDSISVPAQGGTNGTFTVGTGTALGPIGRDVLGILAWDPGREPGAWAVGEIAPVLRSGRIWVTVEEAVETEQQAFVRLVIAGAEVRGAFRASPDGTAGAPDAVPLINAKFVTSTSGAGVAQLEVTLS